MPDVQEYLGRSSFDDILRFRTFAELIDARRADSRVFITEYSNQERSGTITFSAFSKAVARMSRQLKTEGGVRAGERIGVVMSNSIAALVAYAAVMYAGATIVPLNPNESDEYFGFVTSDADLVGVIGADPGSCERAGPLRFSACCEGTSLTWKRRGRPRGRPSRRPTPESEGSVLYTSGSTGRTKGVCVTQGQWMLNAQGLADALAMTVMDTQLCVLPIFHGNAFGLSFMSGFYAGLRLVLCDQIVPEAYWQIVAEEKVTICSLVPSLIQMLMDQGGASAAAGRRLSSVRYATSGAAALGVELARQFLEEFGIRILQGYGMSEGTCFSVMTEPDLSDREYAEIMFGASRTTVGTPIIGCDIAVMREDGSIAEESEEGEIVMRGWNIMTGYNAAPQATAQAIHGGWLHSGDVGSFRTFRGKRYFSISGRMKEIVKRRNFAVSLIETDERLRLETGMEDVVTVGFPNRYVSEEIGLFVVPNEKTPGSEAILERCREIFPAYRVPRAVVTGASIPRTSVGKVQRQALVPLFEHLVDVEFG